MQKKTERDAWIRFDVCLISIGKRNEKKENLIKKNKVKNFIHLIQSESIRLIQFSLFCDLVFFFISLNAVDAAAFTQPD